MELKRGVCLLVVLVASPTVGSAATWPVSTSAGFQAALNQAIPGDIITIPAGSEISGNFTLPLKPAGPRISIRSSSADAFRTGVRLDPRRDAGLLARIRTPNTTPAFRFDRAASGYEFVGLEIAATEGVYVTDLVVLGTGLERLVTDLPNDVEIRHCWLHGSVTEGSKRGIRANARAFTLRDSYINDIKSKGQETQAVAWWAGPGPTLIENNYLEASGINILIGGAAPLTVAMLPSNIGIYGNYLNKPLAWRSEGWSAKNHFEVKVGRNIKFSYNVLENSWISAQVGFSINLKVVTCDTADYPWSVTKNVTISHNAILNTANGITVTGTDTSRSTCWTAGAGTMTTAGSLVLGTGTRFTLLQPGWRITAGGQTRTIASIASDTSLTVDSAFSPNIGAPTAYTYNQPTAGQLSDLFVQENLVVASTAALQVLRGTKWTAFQQNTFIHSGTAVIADVLPASNGLQLRANVFTNDTGMGIKGSGAAEGLGTISLYFPGSDISANILGNETDPKIYPPGNFLAATTAAIGMVDMANGNYALSASSPYAKKAPSGRDPGADINFINQMRTMAVTGTFNRLAVPRYP